MRSGSETDFPGPLDLLLDEVRRQNVAVEDIAMAPIVARFLDYLRTAAERNLNLDIEWLHMAATLIHWKSQALLPRDTTGEAQADPIRDELIRQLLAHRQEAATELARRRAVEERRFSRPPEVPRPIEEDGGGGAGSVWEMIQQARDLARWAEQQVESRRRWRQSFHVAKDDVTVGEMMDYIRVELAAGHTVDGLSLLDGQPTPARRACLFLALLEMARGQEIQLEQSEMFGSIRVTPAGG